ncbi:MAG: protocatechuate 3,4-dioxygenase subunit beta [Chromatiales bacterium]|jgi:protocatechuate 3,4-dioxygenase, beta subunit|nr:protocatechuate 3,4-dioxygenase subunit beta [Chromatiales bacterium]
MSAASNPHPPYLYPDYKSTVLRAPTRPLIPLPGSLSERTGPIFSARHVSGLDDDLTKNGVKNGAAIGERIVVTGRVTDVHGTPLPDTVIELWQANAAGRYVHPVDDHNAPLDPNFFGAGRCVTDAAGEYRFYTIKPGAYPWGNHENGWRPAHIHFSLFGPTIATRLITQMYFPGDPLLPLDPIFESTPIDSRTRLVARFSLDVTEPGFALGFVFDLVLGNALASPAERGANLERN